MSLNVAEPRSQARAVAGRQRRAGARWVALGGWLLAVGLLAWGGWRLVRDFSPLPGLAQIERLIQKQHLSEAETALRSILDRSPDHGDARMMLARLLARRGDLRACAEELHRIPHWWPGKRKALFLEGQTSYESHLARRAEAAWLACVRDDPLHPAEAGLVKNAAQALVALYVLQGRVDDARRVLWSAYDQASDAEKPAVLGTRVRVELERIEPQEAVATMRRFVEADADDHESRRALALALQFAGKPAEADRAIERCLRERPTDPTVWRTWLEILQDRNDPVALKQAIDQSDQARSLTRDPSLLKALAAALENEGNLERAAEALRDALAADPFDEEVHYRMARVMLRLGEDRAAAEHRARHQVLRDARDALPKALSEYGDASRTSTDGARVQLAIQQLGDLCETLGWPRLAEAWRAQLH